ncbi:MAG TPA: hypothetical protein VNH18_24620 [Bryobacteraceae bacterium]|nr:hypothetical protein [Bryobacteraceae bacterium]
MTNSEPKQQIATPSRLLNLLNNLLTSVHHHYDNLLPGVDALLAMFGAMALRDRTKPLSLMFEAPSGAGKSAIVQMAFPLPDSGLHAYVYRSDKFTPRAFVSHAANVQKDELAKMDLLPKLEGKVLITKEMAPLFRGRVEELQDTFSILIAVLDGKGLLSDTGMRGQRGYDRSIIFNWIGATTPLPPATHRLMSQLGTRLLFFEMPPFEVSDEDLLRYAEDGDPGLAESECKEAMNELLVGFFAEFPVGSVNPKSISLPQPLLTQLIRWAKFLARCRAEVKFEKDNGRDWVPVAVSPPEAPFKIVTYFKDLALGRALIYGRETVDESDIDLVGEVAISSVPGHFRPIVRALRLGEVRTERASKVCAVSAPTARNYMAELALLGIAELTKGNAASNQADSLVLAAPYKWLLKDLEG